MAATHELSRAIRHTLAPLAVFAVQKGWLPEAMQHDIVEAAAILASLALVYLWSLRKDRSGNPDG